MPKLNTTIDNLELKSNKIISTSTDSPDMWTDAQYASAKTLLNVAHPVGSILTTSTNTNPAATLGGTWTLVDKSFKNTALELGSSSWTKPSEAALGSSLLEGSIAILSDHTISIRLNVSTTVALSDVEVYLGKLVLQDCGVTELIHASMYDVAFADSSNCTVCYRLEKNGTFSVWDVLGQSGTHSAPSGTSFYIHVVQPVFYNQMLDEFCDKFYWRRTA